MNEELLKTGSSSIRRPKARIALSVLFGLLLIGILWHIGGTRHFSETDKSANKLTLAKKHLSEGQLDFAEQSLLAHLQRHPQSNEALEELRWLYFNQFRTRDIEVVLENHLARFPDDFGVAIELLNCEFRKQLPREGMGYLLEMNQKHPGQPTVQLALGYCHWQIGEVGAARELFDKALAQRPDHRETRYIISDFFLDNGETEAAAELLNGIADATKNFPSRAEQPVNDREWFLRSLIAERQGNIDVAYQSIEQAIALRPSELPYLHREGLLLQRLKRQKEASIKLQRANVLEGFQTELSEIVLRGQHTEPTPEICERIAKLLHEFSREIPSHTWHLLGLRLASTLPERRQ